MGMMNMLGLAKRVKARILQASTSEVNAPCIHRQPHTANTRPRFEAASPRPALPNDLRGEEHGTAALSHSLTPPPAALSPASLTRLPALVCVPQVYGDPEISPQPEEY